MLEISRAIGISVSTVYAWRRWISRKRASAASPRPSLVQVRVRREVSLPESTAVGTRPLIVGLVGGRRVEVPCGFDAAELARLLSVLEPC